MKSIKQLAGVAALAFATGAFAQGTANQPAMQPSPNMNNNPSMNSWAKSQNGAITKQQYMNEASRRWDAMDRSGKGLTADQIGTMYGDAPTPTNPKQPSNQTNPSGTELKGQNSGGK